MARRAGAHQPTLTDAYPQLAAELADPTLAAVLTGGSVRVVDWHGTCGHAWPARVRDRVRGQGCLVCAGRRVVAGVNDLATVNPALAAQLVDPTLAATLTSGTRTVTTWRCPDGHLWDAAVKTRTAGRGCPVCTNQEIRAGVNDLATTNPALAAQLVDASIAQEVSAGSHRKVDWQCEAGHVWSARVAKRTRGSGCPGCHRERQRMYAADPMSRPHVAGS